MSKRKRSLTTQQKAHNDRIEAEIHVTKRRISMEDAEQIDKEICRFCNEEGDDVGEEQPELCNKPSCIAEYNKQRLLTYPPQPELTGDLSFGELIHFYNSKEIKALRKLGNSVKKSQIVKPPKKNKVVQAVEIKKGGTRKHVKRRRRRSTNFQKNKWKCKTKKRHR